MTTNEVIGPDASRNRDGSVPKLNADFLSDLVASVRSHMAKKWGAEIARINDGNILALFFDSQRRTISARARNIRAADDFNCPQAQENGWKALQNKIRSGEDIGPHLSTRHRSLFSLDGLLNEWGVHHFHLGVRPHHQRPDYIERSGPVVFALVDETTFYAINVYDHGNWEETSIIESLHRNWPEVIGSYRLRGITGEQLSALQRRTIRKQRFQAAVTTRDGTVYGPIGGPISSAGTKLDSVCQADKWSAEIRNLQSRFEAELYKVVPLLEQRGYAGEQVVEAELQVMKDGYRVFFPRFNVRAQLEII